MLSIILFNLIFHKLRQHEEGVSRSVSPQANRVTVLPFQYQTSESNSVSYLLNCKFALLVEITGIEAVSALTLDLM